jgi:uncharacterized protein DUF1876
VRDHPAPTSGQHVKSWRVTIDLYESGDDTTAHAVLLAESPIHIDARGLAHRDAAGAAIPEIGDEVAVPRHRSDHFMSSANR